MLGFSLKKIKNKNILFTLKKILYLKTCIFLFDFNTENGKIQ